VRLHAMLCNHSCVKAPAVSGTLCRFFKTQIECAHLWCRVVDFGAGWLQVCCCYALCHIPTGYWVLGTVLPVLQCAQAQALAPVGADECLQPAAALCLPSTEGDERSWEISSLLQRVLVSLFVGNSLLPLQYFLNASQRSDTSVLCCPAPGG
jgi:hypothetical protein